jgi:hypothetical protein
MQLIFDYQKLESSLLLNLEDRFIDFGFVLENRVLITYVESFHSYQLLYDFDLLLDNKT